MRRKPLSRDAYRFWCEEKLRNADTDQFRHVNNAAIASMLESARMEAFASEVHARLGGATLAVVHLAIDFHRELFYPGSVAVGSAVIRTGRTSFSVRQGVFDSDGCAASADVTCVLFDPALRRPLEMSLALRDFLDRARPDPAALGG